MHYIISSAARVNRLASTQGFEHEPKSFRCYLLNIMRHHNGTCSFQDIVRAMPIDKGTVSRQLLSLEQDGYVRRYLAEGSARRKCASLTPQGEAYINKVMESLLQGEQKMRKHLKSVEYKRLQNYLARMHTNLVDSGRALVPPQEQWPLIDMYFFQCTTEIYRLMNGIRSKLGLLLPEQRIIMGLGFYNDWTEYKTFEHRFVISQQEVAKTFTNLAAREIVEVRAKEDDKRAREARLLPKGEALREKILAEHKDWLQVAFKQLNEKSQAEFLRLLNIFFDNIDACYGK